MMMTSQYGKPGKFEYEHHMSSHCPGTLCIKRCPHIKAAALYRPEEVFSWSG